MNRTSRRLPLMLACLLVAALLGPASSQAGVANDGIPGAPASNPIAGVKWGTFLHPSSQATIDAPSAYLHRAGVTDQKYFRAIVDVPRFRWFGAWIPQHGDPRISKLGIYASTRAYIDQITGGNPDIGVQIATFRLQPWEGAARTTLPTSAQVKDYKTWIDTMAQAIGDRQRAAIVVQPDGPLARVAPHHSPWAFRLMSYTARTFNALDHTTVYIDAGAADWLSPRDAARYLVRSGIRWARGYSLNLTHSVSNGRSVAYAKQVNRLLARAGYPNRHAVIDTSHNGRPFTYRAAKRSHFSGNVCPSLSARRCITFGRLPTVNTGTRAVDSFMWLGRPWWNNASLRSYGEVLDLVKYSPVLSKLL